jgi:hypothetical protein
MRRFVLAFAITAVIGCSGAGHRKVAGPPPEYELPDEPDAALAPLRAQDAGPR